MVLVTFTEMFLDELLLFVLLGIFTFGSMFTNKIGFFFTFLGGVGLLIFSIQFFGGIVSALVGIGIIAILWGSLD